MPREDEGSGAKHAREQQVVAADAGEDDLETASGTSATGTDVERDEYVEAIYEDAINEANKGRSLVHDALNSCSEPIFMILVGLQLLEVSRELSEVEAEDENHKIEGVAYVYGMNSIVSGAIFSFMCLYAWLASSMKSGLQALKGRSEMPFAQFASMLIILMAIFYVPEVKTKIIEDPSNLLFLAMGTFTDVVDYWAGVKATLKAHEHGAYTFPLTQVSPLLHIVLEFIAAPVTLVVGVLLSLCGLFLLIVFCCCLFPILYITRVVNGVQRAFVEDFLSVARLPVNIIKWGGNLGSEGPSSRKLNAKTGVENLPEDAVNHSRVFNAYGIYTDVLMWVVLFTNLSVESVLGLN
ncbi:Hypothetical Protein FCC1311_034492 [Hondaea fermentalgiana]|uniref:Uncharacterized protein n=1 Tax=Hondaea fermentalgiana TaxID=2315210 RepID=A0A2R5G857_9STRA|nr:Hypothetical Protein FCC1311_034492 [Hondaea fermentalgiana]|eukprot:GBG27227.1 Hypothetical Protein FCC1311_034492 [Hondaea fermentalgiana]